MKVGRIYLKNFLGLSTATKRNEIEIERFDSENKIVLILGSNGSGKSSLLNEITPYPLEHTEGRNTSRIIPDTVGIKELDLLDKDIMYKCKIIYEKNKTNCFLTKINLLNNETIELNPNGNVTSYIELLDNELGLNKKFMNISYLSDSITNFIYMKSTERNSYISTFLPDISDFLKYYDKSSKKINQYKKEIFSINSDLTKFKDLNVEMDLKILNNNNENIKNEIRTIRDELVKLDVYTNSLTLDLSILDNFEKYKTINNFRYEKLISDRIDIMKRWEEIEKFNNNPSMIKEEINFIVTDIKILETQLNNKYEEIKNSNIKYNDININLSNINISEDDTIFSSFDDLLNEKEELNKYLSKLSLSENEKKIDISDIKIIENDILKFQDIRNSIEYIDGIDLLCLEKYDRLYISDIEKIKTEYNNLEMKINDIDVYIQSIRNVKIDKNIIEARPKSCKMECPMFDLIQKYTNPETEIDKYLEKKNKLISELEEKQRKLNSLVILKENNSLIENSVAEIKKIINKYEHFFININFNFENATSLFSNLNSFINYLRNLRENKSILDRYNAIVDNVEKMINKKKIMDVSENFKKELYLLKEKIIKDNKDIEIIHKDIVTLESKLNLLKNIKYELDKIKKNIKDNELDLNNYEYDFRLTQEKIKQKGLKYIFKNRRIELEIRLNELEKLLLENEAKIERNKNITNTLEIKNDRKNILEFELDIITKLNNECSPKIGFPSLIIEDFLIDLKKEVNLDLELMWGSDLKIEEFILNKDEFSIAINRSGMIIPDVSACSDGERAILGLSISLSIVKLNLINNKYNILRFDEIDAKLDEDRRRLFLEILQIRINNMGIENLFIITHNNEFENINTDMILLNGYSNNIGRNKNIIFKL